MKLKRPLYGSGWPGGPTRGTDVLMVKRALDKTKVAELPGPPYDDVYNSLVVEQMKRFQKAHGIRQTGQFGQATLDALWPFFDAYGKLKYSTFRVPPTPPPAPRVVFPIAAGHKVYVGGLHETGGLPGNWALDFICAPGSPIVAAEDAIVTRFSGRDPDDDTWDTQGVYGWTTYLASLSRVYEHFLTHQGRRAVGLVVGQKVVAGQVLGYVGDQDFRPDHLHLGVSSTLGPTDAKRHIEAIASAPKVAVDV